MKCSHQSSRKVARKAINVIEPLFRPARNSVYKNDDLVKAVLGMGVEGTVRASAHYYNLEAEVEEFVSTVERIVRDFGV